MDNKELITYFNKTAVNFDAYVIFLTKLPNSMSRYISIDCKKLAKSGTMNHLLSLNNFPQGERYTQKKNGINIVIYDSLNKILLDSVCFDLIDGNVWREGRIISSIDFRTMTLRDDIKEIRMLNKSANKIYSDIFFNQINCKKDFHKAIPKATGLLRLQQHIMLYTLYNFDKLCRRLDIPYFIYAGTLLGAQRCGGYVPWDDDVDVIVMTDGFYKLFEYDVLAKQFDDMPPTFLRIRGKNHSLAGARFRIKTFYNAIDVFVYSYSDSMSENYRKSLRRLKQSHVDQTKQTYGEDFFKNPDIFLKAFDDLNKSFQEKYNKKNSKEYMMGSFFIGSDNCAFPTSCIFPLSEINFEGFKFKAPHDVDSFLKIHFGDYWKLPINMSGHFNKWSYKELKHDIDLIKKYDPEFYAKIIQKDWEAYHNENK